MNPPKARSDLTDHVEYSTVANVRSGGFDRCERSCGCWQSWLAMTEEPPRTLDTTDTSIDVLETIRDLDGATLVGLQRRLDLPKSTLYYHVKTLEHRGYVVREGDEYHLGMKFLLHGQYLKTRKREFELAHGATQRLADRLDEDADFSVEEHGRLMVVHHVVGESVKHGFGFQLARPINLPATAAGRAILAEYPRSKVEDIVSRRGFGGLDGAPSDMEALFERLEAVRTTGYAVNDEEWVEGLCAVSASVTEPDGSVLGALSVIVPSFRFDDEHLDDLTTPLRSEVSDLEERLESRPVEGG